MHKKTQCKTEHNVRIQCERSTNSSTELVGSKMPWMSGKNTASMHAQNMYEFLQKSPSASLAELRLSHRKKCKGLEQDNLNRPGSKAAWLYFRNVLKSDQTRQAYDAELATVISRKEMNEIEPNLWLGSVNAARDTTLLNAHNIKTILTVAKDCLDRAVNRDIDTHVIVPVMDNMTEDMLPHLQVCINTINDSLAACKPILVHCVSGVSRSATAVIAWLMQKYRLNVAEAFTKLKAIRDLVEPNPIFMHQLALFGDMGCPTELPGDYRAQLQKVKIDKYNWTWDKDTALEHMKLRERKEQKLLHSMSTSTATAKGITVPSIPNARVSIENPQERRSRVYAQTDHYLMLPPKHILQAPRPAIRRIDLPKPVEGFILENVLSRAECKWFISQAESAGWIFGGYSGQPGIRIVDKCTSFSEEVAAVLFERSKVHFERKKGFLRWGLAGFGETGKKLIWNPVELNPTFRICRYKPGGLFRPHRDGGWDERPDLTSFKTFMLYLNDGFDGGPTRFFNENQQCYVAADDDNVVFSYSPKAGSLLCFDSEIVHEGGKLLASGHEKVKYIMRSEVMYSPASS